MSSIVCASQCCKVFGKIVKNLNRSEFIMMISSLLTTRLFLQISATCFCKQLWISLMMDHPRHSILKRKHRNYGTKIETGLEVHYIAFDAVKKPFEKADRADIKHCGNSNCLTVTSCSKIFKHLYGWTQLPSIAHLQHSSSELSSLSESEISWCVSWGHMDNWKLWKRYAKLFERNETFLTFCLKGQIDVQDYAREWERWANTANDWKIYNL